MLHLPALVFDSIKITGDAVGISDVASRAWTNSWYMNNGINVEAAGVRLVKANIHAISVELRLWYELRAGVAIGATARHRIFVRPPNAADCILGQFASAHINVALGFLSG